MRLVKLIQKYYYDLHGFEADSGKKAIKKKCHLLPARSRRVLSQSLIHKAGLNMTQLGYHDVSTEG